MALVGQGGTDFERMQAAKERALEDRKASEALQRQLPDHDFNAYEASKFSVAPPAYVDAWTREARAAVVAPAVDLHIPAVPVDCPKGATLPEGDQDAAAYDGLLLIARQGGRVLKFYTQQYDVAGYWAAWHGIAAGFSAPAESCLASLEGALELLPGMECACRAVPAVYVVFRPQRCTAAAWVRWSGKWSARTE